MIPMTAEYALRAVVVLASAPGKARSADEIAEATRVPRRYVHKVLQALVRARLVRSQPGPGGGYALLPAADQVSILDVVAAVEPIPRIRHCPLELKAHTSLCPLHRELDQACAAIEGAFARVTIAQLQSQTGGEPPLCKVEKPRRKGARSRRAAAALATAHRPK
jgi:Rrf2 family protein